MIVEIFSIHPAVSATPCGTTWRGDLDLSLASSDEDLWNWSSGLFNRVDEGDHERMEAMGYMMPSLSVGDFVTLHLDELGPKGRSRSRRRGASPAWASRRSRTTPTT